jgi:protein gp37
VFVEMAKRPHIHFQVLTKRPARMAEFAQEIVFAGRRRGPDASQPVPWVWPENVWAGTTVEDQQRADERIPWLRQIPAKVRFLSVEPMLGAVDISNHLWPACWHWDGRFDSPEAALAADDGWAKQKPQGLLSSHVAKTLINWVIVGGESGHHARPSSPAWFRSLREQCEGSGTAFFFKQWGEWVPGNGYAGDDLYDRVRKQHDGTLFGDDRKGTGSGVRSGFFNYNDVWHELGPNPFRQTMDRVGRANDPQTLDGIEHHAFPRTP